MSIVEAINRLDNPRGNGNPETPADRLAQGFTACSLSFKPWWSNSKGLTDDQKKQAAQALGAEKIKGGSVLLWPDNPKILQEIHREMLKPAVSAVKALGALRNATRKTWEDSTLPYPDDGVRLVPLANVAILREKLHDHRSQIPALRAAMEETRSLALSYGSHYNGCVFSPSDYPESFDGLHHIGIDWPTITPPDYLRQIDPQAYEEARSHAMARLDVAVQKAEQAFVDQMAKIVDHLTDVLTGGADGRPKVFRDSAIGNLREFFSRFRELNVRSNADLDRLVETAEEAIQGIGPQDLRDSGFLRQRVAERMTEVREHLTDIAENRPRRQIDRRPR